MPTSFKKTLSAKSWLTGALAGFASAAVLAGCIGHEDNVATTGDRPTFEEFKESIYKEPWEGGVYIVNGDTPIEDEKKLEEFYKRVFVDEQLIVNQVNGVDAHWSSSQKRNISYCISNAFGANKSRMVSAMANAAAQWESAGDVEFVYQSSQDGNCTATNNNVLFDIRPVSGQGYLARAFFPSSSRISSNVLVDNTSFSTSWPLENILAHELGHVLGFRHEHTRPEAGTCFENTSWRPLTPYDKASIMHYPQCNGLDTNLEMSQGDRDGIRALYGAPGGSQPPPTTGVPQTATVSGTLARSETDNYDPLSVLPGTEITAEISGTGDADLYVRFGSAPSLTRYDCRPYRNGSSERCSLDVPAGVSEAFIMVRGYRSATYNLEVSWVAPR